MNGADIDTRSARVVAQVIARTTVPRADLALLVGVTPAETVAFAMKRTSLANHLRRQARGNTGRPLSTSDATPESDALNEMAAHALGVKGIPMVLVTAARATVGTLDLKELERHETIGGRGDGPRARVDVLMSLAARPKGERAQEIRLSLAARHDQRAVEYAIVALQKDKLIALAGGRRGMWQCTEAGMAEAKRIVERRSERRAA